MNINSTSSSSSSGSSTNYGRITGLATGLDIDGLVKQGLAGEQAKIDKENQDKQYLQWQQEAYVDVTTDLKDLYGYFDILNPKNLLTSSNYAGTVASSTNSTAISATTLAGAIKGNYQVSVTQIAEGAKQQSIALPGATTSQSTLASLGLGITNGNITINVNVNGTPTDFTVAVDTSKTVDQFINDVKSATSGGTQLGSLINVSYSELTKKLSFETKTTGSTQSLTITDSATNGGNFVSKLIDPAAAQPGQDAVISITPPGDSNSYTVTKSSNTFTVDNIAYNIKDVTTAPATISVTADASAQVQKFKDFINKYNSLVEKLNTKVSEKKSYSYKPLTDTQRSSMKDSEITNWEKEAKKGIIRRDDDIMKLLSDMRSSIYKTVNNAGINISDIGLSTTNDFMDGGKLQLDETKFQNALQDRGDLVQKLFTQSSTDDDSAGIFQRLKKEVDGVVGLNGTLIKKAGYVNSKYALTNDITQKINAKNDKIKSIQKIMSDKQQRLYSMYATLEKNMNSLNSQSSWLASSLGAQ